MATTPTLNCWFLPRRETSWQCSPHSPNPATWLLRWRRGRRRCRQLWQPWFLQRLPRRLRRQVPLFQLDAVIAAATTSMCCRQCNLRWKSGWQHVSLRRRRPRCHSGGCREKPARRRRRHARRGSCQLPERLATGLSDLDIKIQHLRRRLI